MEMKYVVPDMAQSFGTFEFAGESEPVFERDKNNRRVLARRSYNLYSDVQLSLIHIYHHTGNSGRRAQLSGGGCVLFAGISQSRN